MHSIGILGGTFDPIHHGHLRTALELQHKLSLQQIRFVPSAHPPHRTTPTASIELRLRMARAAIEDCESFVVDDRERGRPGPSYTVDTLTDLRADYADSCICLILGMDAFLDLPNWHEWQRLLGLAHIVVAHRPPWSLPRDGTIGALIESNQASDPAELLAQRHGRILIESVTQLEISATQLRASIRAGMEPKYLVPDSVWKIIRETGCYAARA